LIVRIITPAPPGSQKGNRVTALRWSRLLRSLGHRVVIEQRYQGGECDVLVALHARRSFPSVDRYRRERPAAPLILALTGTDLYRDIRTSPRARRSLELATRLVLLQPAGIAELPEALRSKARVIYQSVDIHTPITRSRGYPPHDHTARQRPFVVCVLGHLRPVKDPFRAARAARRLPASSRICIVHVGAALSPSMADYACREIERNPRYRWLGELPRWKALRTLAGSQLLALTSRMEGGANAISEAIACSVPVVSSRISGSIGLLGEDYPGYFPGGDTRALADLLLRAERDAAFYQELARRCASLRPLFDPAREQEAWARLLEELAR
jgi:putative glycosyltransferase (TIGR04348 family)